MVTPKLGVASILWFNFIITKTAVHDHQGFSSKISKAKNITFRESGKVTCNTNTYELFKHQNIKTCLKYNLFRLLFHVFLTVGNLLKSYLV